MTDHAEPAISRGHLTLVVDNGARVSRDQLPNDSRPTGPQPMAAQMDGLVVTLSELADTVDELKDKLTPPPA